jgi:hypothetical protein
MSEVERYVKYYQAQSQGLGISPKFSRTQKGMGIGSFLGNLFRRIAPYLFSGARAVGGELLDTGVNLLKDRINNKDIKQSLDTHLGNAGKNLATKASSSVKSMLGMGYKRKRTTARAQSRPVKRRKKTPNKIAKRKSSKNKKTKASANKKKKDIFGF